MWKRNTTPALMLPMIFFLSSVVLFIGIFFLVFRLAIFLLFLPSLAVVAVLALNPGLFLTFSWCETMHLCIFLHFCSYNSRAARP